MTTPNVHPDEITRFEKLAARWWGEPGSVATCREGQVAPASARAGTRRNRPRHASAPPSAKAMDGAGRTLLAKLDAQQAKAGRVPRTRDGSPPARGTRR